MEALKEPANAEIKETVISTDNPSDDRAGSSTEKELHSAKTILESHGIKIIRPIGSGSYSKVKLAYSETHKTTVAVKIVSKYKVPTEFLKKFLYNEIKVVRQIRHENIIKYYQSIETSHRLYVIMQYAENGSILDLIHNTKYLKEAMACRYFKQLLSALEYLHGLGICHRDLKCENILLDKRNVIKIIDFGFGKVLGRSDSVKSEQEKKMEKLIESGVDAPPPLERKEATSHVPAKRKDPLLSETYCGSYAYASPEILKGIPYDPRKSDIWALGVVLFAMVFGRLPFDDRDVKQLLKQVDSTVKFPSNPPVSDLCKNLLKGILAPLRYRYSIDEIKNHQWLAKFEVEKTENQATK